MFGERELRLTDRSRGNEVDSALIFSLGASDAGVLFSHLTLKSSGLASLTVAPVASSCPAIPDSDLTAAVAGLDRVRGWGSAGSVGSFLTGRRG